MVDWFWKVKAVFLRGLIRVCSHWSNHPINTESKVKIPLGQLFSQLLWYEHSLILRNIEHQPISKGKGGQGYLPGKPIPKI